MISRILHFSLHRLGYWIRRTSVLPFGIDYLLDIRRLADRYGIVINDIIDVGAHTGQSVTAFHRTWPDAHVIAIEADPQTYKALAGSTFEGRVTRFNLALSDSPGTGQFYRFGDKATCNSLSAENQFAIHTGLKPKESLTVRCETLDNLVRDLQLNHIDLIKIDTEGHELKILNGSIETLSRRNVKFVFLEFNSVCSVGGRQEGSLAPLAEKLESLGFHFVATYPELSLEDQSYFSTSNALFFRNVKSSA